MKKKLLILLILPLFIISASFLKSQKKDVSKPEILVTIAPYKYFIEQLTDNSVEVKNLIPEDDDPHTFEPPAKELMSLFSAKAWFLTGEPFESQFVPIIQKNDPGIAIVHLEDVSLDQHKLDASHTCCHHHDHDTNEDLHFWMSPHIMQKQVHQIATTLKEIYPEKKATIEKRLSEIDLEFAEYDALIAEEVKKRSP